jgi:hypothetical protein
VLAQELPYWLAARNGSFEAADSHKALIEDALYQSGNEVFQALADEYRALDAYTSLRAPLDFNSKSLPWTMPIPIAMLVGLLICL